MQLINSPGLPRKEIPQFDHDLSLIFVEELQKVCKTSRTGFVFGVRSQGLLPALQNGMASICALLSMLKSPRLLQEDDNSSIKKEKEINLSSALNPSLSGSTRAEMEVDFMFLWN